MRRFPEGKSPWGRCKFSISWCDFCRFIIKVSPLQIFYHPFFSSWESSKPVIGGQVGHPPGKYFT